MYLHMHPYVAQEQDTEYLLVKTNEALTCSRAPVDHGFQQLLALLLFHVGSPVNLQTMFMLENPILTTAVCSHQIMEARGEKKHVIFNQSLVP